MISHLNTLNQCYFQIYPWQLIEILHIRLHEIGNQISNDCFLEAECGKQKAESLTFIIA